MLKNILPDSILPDSVQMCSFLLHIFTYFVNLSVFQNSGPLMLYFVMILMFSFLIFFSSHFEHFHNDQHVKRKF